MTARPKIILFELNEVPFRVMDDFCARHPDSVLARVLPRSTQYVTHTGDEPLSPWITWPTLHRGVEIGQHGIAHLGMDTTEVDEEFPPVWKTLAARGLRVGVFGSLHSYPAPSADGEYAFYVPDTFAADGRCIPSSIDAFQDFNLHMARSSARNVPAQVPWKEGLKVLAGAPRLGLRATTIASVVQQLLVERIRLARMATTTSRPLVPQARNPLCQCVPSQKGLLPEPPHLHSANRARTSYGVPSSETTGIRPTTRYGPFFEAVIPGSRSASTGAGEPGSA